MSIVLFFGGLTLLGLLFGIDGERYLTDKTNYLPSSYGRKFAVGVKRIM